MCNRSFMIGALVIGLLTLAGCRPDKLSDVSTVTLDDASSAKSRDLPAQKLPQTITVEFTSPVNEVSVLVFKRADVPDNDSLDSADSAKAIGKVLNSKGDKLSVEVPANTETRVVVRNKGKKAEVNLKITN